MYVAKRFSLHIPKLFIKSLAVAFAAQLSWTIAWILIGYTQAIANLFSRQFMVPVNILCPFSLGFSASWRLT